MTALIEQLASDKLDKSTVAAAYVIGIAIAVGVLAFFGALGRLDPRRSEGRPSGPALYPSTWLGGG